MYAADELFEFIESDFRMAFTVEGRYNLERKDDPRFVKYLVYINELVNGEFKRKEVSYHPCTDKDYD